MFFHVDDNSFVFTDANSFKFLSLYTAGYLTIPTGTTLFKAKAPLQITADKENSDFPATNCNVVDDPYLEYLSTDALETILQITFLEPIDTLFIANVNFSSFKITVNSVDLVISSFKNVDTGIYNGICFFDGDVNSITLTITAQTPIDSASYFSIGAIAGGNKTVLNPRYEAARRVIEPSDILRFNNNNKEINNSLRTHHVFTINFNNLLTAAEMTALKTLENEVGMNGVVVVYEYYTDRETGILGERVGTFDYSEKDISYYDNVISIKEKV